MEEEWCISGVGFAIKSNIVKDLPSLQKGENDRIMTLRMEL